MGGGTLTWRAIVTDTWISLIDGSGEFAETGTVSAAGPVTIRVRINRETAPVNPDTAYVQFTSSNFPRFSRNLNTGEDVATGTRMLTAKQTVLHTRQYPSHVVLPLVDAD